jgi:hypothetical protein
MKAQADSNSRGQKDFICREFSWRKEKRKIAYWRMQGDLSLLIKDLFKWYILSWFNFGMSNASRNLF